MSLRYRKVTKWHALLFCHFCFKCDEKMNKLPARIATRSVVGGSIPHQFDLALNLIFSRAEGVAVGQDLILTYRYIRNLVPGLFGDMLEIL